ncbi:hypothetical protein VIGAN_08125400, partial [Vigna angularis var. angularis]
IFLKVFLSLESFFFFLYLLSNLHTAPSIALSFRWRPRVPRVESSVLNRTFSSFLLVLLNLFLCEGYCFGASSKVLCL